MADAQVLKDRFQKYAKARGVVLQPDARKLDIILKGLNRNDDKHGHIYCPCRKVTGDHEVDRKNMCPCVFHLDEVKDDGHCKCFLFLAKEETAPSA